MARLVRQAFVMVLAGMGAGCVAAAAAAGAGGAVYVTSRGAEALVEGQPATLESRIRSVLERHDVAITETGTSDGGDTMSWGGKAGELDVSVTAKRESPSTTKVTVTARRNVADWDKEFAERLLQEIVAGR